MSASPNLKLPFLDPNQSQKTVTHNAALTVLDALVNLRVASTTLQAPPASLNDGQCWIVAAGGTGAWAGKDLNVAAWQDGAWSFYAPNPGFVAYVDALGGALMWNGSAWVSLLGAITQLALTDLGIGTAVDAANPLSAKLNAALFAAVPTTASPAGTGDVRVKLSKQSTGNTASLLFQDSFAGRAEVGLAGDDNFHVKVSPDGTTFYDAMVVTAAGGGVALLGTPTHPTPAAGDSSTRSATTAFVAAAVAASGASVTSVAGRTGAVTLAVGDIAGAAPLASPTLTGTPSAPTAAAGTNTAQLATTSFVAASFISYAYAAANYATSASPTLTGTPTAPTPAVADNSTKLATTAYADRAAAALIARRQVSDTAYTVLSTDRTVAVTALTAARALTLPAASAYPGGATLTVVDESGACSATNTITLAAAGSDTINGAASAVLSAPYGYLALESNTSNRWTVVDQPSGTVAALNGGPLAGSRNRLINGNFAVDQRGYATNTALAAGIYGHDRWKAGAGGCTYTFTTGTPDTGITITAGTLQQIVEAVNVEGGVYTLSWAGSATGRVTYTATGATSATTTAYAASPMLLPGVNAGLAVTVEFGTGTLGKAQLEPGPIATPFERRFPAVELQLCQRYYETSYDAGIAPGTATHNGITGCALVVGATPNAAATIPFHTPKRADPTVSIWDGAGNAGFWSSLASASTWSDGRGAATVFIAAQSGLLVVNTAGLTTGQIVFCHFAASAEL